MEKVLILGINGFTGQYLDHYIQKNTLQKDFEFLGVDKVIDKPLSIKSNKMDLLQAEAVSKLIEREKPDYVMNLIGTFQGENFDNFLTVNVGVTQKLLDSLVKLKIKAKKVLLIGSAAEYGIPATLPVKEEDPLNPVNWYGLTKVLQTTLAKFYVLNHGVPVIIARTFNIIGKGISTALSIGSFIERIKRTKDGDEIAVGNLETKRDFLDVEDVVDAYWKLLLTGKSGEIYNVCRGESHNIKDLLTELIRIAKKSVKVNINRALIKEKDVPDIFGDNSKLRKDTNWQPKIGIKDSLISCF